MRESSQYPIGTTGVPWGASEKSAWLARQVRHRSYRDDVLLVVEQLRACYDVIEYGRLPCDPERYPLMALRSRDWRDDRPIVLVTGGVHGYETSGVHGALRFLEHAAVSHAGRINLLVAPCVSPWGYETIQRWNVDAVDPNRSFVADSPAPEAAALMALVAPFRDCVLLHVDLHETTDTDESEFRPALAARDGKVFQPGVIPDGFYLVDDTEHPQTAFQSAIIDAVARVAHIAPADKQGCIIGSPVVAPGVIRYPLRQLGLCAGMTDAKLRTTTEVYPDSPRMNPQRCVLAQVTAIEAAIEYGLGNAHE